MTLKHKPTFLFGILIPLIVASTDTNSGGICSLDNSECSPESKIPGAIARKWCNFYKTACPCPKKKNHYLEFAVLSGDQHAYKGEFPHMAAIGYGSKEDIKWGCGGALVSEDYILTAAHCLSDGMIPAAWVRLGALKIQDKHQQSGNGSRDGQTHPVIERITHPDYEVPSKYNDIALLKIGPALEADTKSTFSRSIHPACLQLEERDIYPIKATGWERLGTGEDQVSELLSVKLLIDENDECNKTFETEIKTTNQLQRGMDDSLMCFGRRGYAEYVPCKGVFEGPLQSYYHERSCLHTLLGFKSFGKVCGTKHPLAVYTAVPFFLDWIEDHVWKNREICSLDDGYDGECLPIRNCPHIQQLIKKGYKPVNCTLGRKETRVCCPSPYQKIWLPPPVKSLQHTKQRSPGETAKKWCEKYKHSYKSTISEEILSKDEHDYPHLAFIGFKELNNTWWECTGTLISENYVLTAAHCISNSECNPPKWVRLGSQTFKSDVRWTSENGTVAGQVHPIIEIIVHPEYKESSKLNDLALLKIGDPIEANASSTLSTLIHPACLQVSEKPLTEVSSVGVDSLGTSDIFLYDVLDANMTIIDTSICNLTKGSFTDQLGELEKFFTCTKVDSWGGFCLYSLEGPLHILIDQDSCLYEVIGLTSAGQTCQLDQPIAYTRVTPYLSWIEDHVWPLM